MAIQEAIDEADDNYFIIVGAGTYTENITIPNEKDGITLLGANAGSRQAFNLGQGVMNQ